MMYWSSVIIYACVVQGLFLSITIGFHNRGLKIANRFLGVLIFIYSIYMLVPELVRRHTEEVPHLIASVFPLLFIFGPLTLLYVHSICERKLPARWTAHFIPVCVILLLLMPFYIMSGEHKLEFYYMVRAEGMGTYWNLLWGIGCVHISLYALLSAKKVRDYNKTLRENYSNIDRLNVSWLTACLYTFSILWILHISIFFLSQFGIALDPYGIADSVFSIAVGVNLFAIGFMAFRKPEIFSADVNTSLQHASYLKSGLGIEDAEELAETLMKKMREEKPYLNAELTLEELAQKLNVSPKHLSEVLNKKVGSSFYEFVNSHRAREAARLIEDGEDVKMLSVMYDSGFNSKSTFIKYFKKIYRVTPSQFRNRLIK